MNSVLGMQAEACFEAFLKCSKIYKLLTSNLQIHDSNQTLGELDYIVRDLKTQNVLHIELACKFYLYDETAGISEEEKWIGPNRKDRLIDKLEKLKEQQFPLIHAPETQQKLKDLKIEIPTEQKLCLKAFLFLPIKMDRIHLPKNYNDCIVGHWIRTDDLKEDKAALYAIPHKKEWLLPLENISEWYSFPQIIQRIEEQLLNFKSPLIYKKTNLKIEKFFVVWW
ncbi:DUF1853 family protein [Aequorivita sp. H23M31]|uniref:DUF1853 family protein n=1 Tax=Aequorivita ciconiae TaxID=2494375 RepID=A0A410G6V9_9FLAO|nr:DUF1853 family protein [Aequorivita sp. H23M31]QAA83017.1 DUF1853 family protein [Aequorivita sp. H23M31]